MPTVSDLPVQKIAVDPRTEGPAKRRRGPAPKLTRSLIAQAVLEVGFEGLTIASVARQLGVAPGGLYRYVEGRDDLVVAGIDYVFAEMPMSEAKNWQNYLRDEAWARWKLVSLHPGLILALRGVAQPAPEPMARYARCAHAVAAMGLSGRDAFLAVDTVVDLVNDASQQQVALGRVVAEGRVDEFIERQSLVLGNELGEVMREIVLDPSSFFGRKLEVILTGLETACGSGIESQ